MKNLERWITGVLMTIACAAMNGCSTAIRPYEGVPQSGGGEELWVIEKGDPPRQISTDGDPNFGSGTLLTHKPGMPGEMTSIPLRHTDIRAHIVGHAAIVDVTQQFQNPYAATIEVVYVFPLPADARVTEFIMTIGARKIRGIIRERDEARRIYNQAKAQGYVASLFTQNRPDRFTQVIANIEPGKQIDTDIQYFHTLHRVDGWYEFVAPISVAAIMPLADSKAGSYRSGNVNDQTPTRRSGRDISLAVQFDPGVPLNAWECITHETIMNQSTATSPVTVKLADAESITNHDFVLRFKLAGERISSSELAAVRLRIAFAEWMGRSIFQRIVALPYQLRSIASEYGLEPSAEAFIAVDATRKTTVDFGMTATVPAGKVRHMESKSTALPNP